MWRLALFNRKQCSRLPYSSLPLSRCWTTGKASDSRTWINIALGERVWLFLPNGAKLPTFFYNWSFAVWLNISIILTRNISTQLSTLGTTGRATAALTMQPQSCTRKEEKEIRNRIFYVKWSDFKSVRGNRSSRRKPTMRVWESTNQIHVQLMIS